MIKIQALSTELTHVISIAIKAGKLAKALQEKNRLTLNKKKFNEIVSDADLQADAIIRKGLLLLSPGSKIYSEESHQHISPKQAQEGVCWIVDPIDGTVNFIHGLTQCAVSIAKAVNGKIVLGVVYNIFLGEIFYAQKNMGAYLNNKKIWCNNHGDTSRAIIAFGFPYDKTQRRKLLEQQHKVLGSFQDMRRLGSAALDLSYIACGRLDGYFENVKPWDAAAGRLIAEEAGVKVDAVAHAGFSKNLSGQKLVAASPKLFTRLKKAIGVNRC